MIVEDKEYKAEGRERNYLMESKRMGKLKRTAGRRNEKETERDGRKEGRKKMGEEERAGWLAA